MQSFYVYIMSNHAHTLYVGMTGENLFNRVRQHRERVNHEAFTARYTYDRLIYFEVLPTHADAIAREKQLKGWRRAKKVALIQAKNPEWLDLTQSWVDLLEAR